MDEQLAARTSVADDGTRVVWLAGELDMATYELAARNFRLALRQAGPMGVAIDMSALSFIDASGVRALVWARHCANEAGVRVRLRGMHGLVARVLSLCALTDIVETISPASMMIAQDVYPSEWTTP